MKCSHHWFNTAWKVPVLLERTTCIAAKYWNLIQTLVRCVCCANVAKLCLAFLRNWQHKPQYSEFQCPEQYFLNKLTSEWEERVCKGRAAQLGSSSLLFSVLCASLGPLPSASLWGGCRHAPLWGLYIRPVPHFKERAQGQCTPPPTQIHSAHSWFLHVCVNVYVCLTLTLSGPL